MIYKETIRRDDENGKEVYYRMYNDAEKEMAHATISTCKTRFAGQWIPTMTVGGVGKIDLKQLETRNARIDLGGVAKMDLGKVTGQSVERISKRSSLCVLGRGE